VVVGSVTQVSATDILAPGPLDLRWRHPTEDDSMMSATRHVIGLPA